MEAEIRFEQVDGPRSRQCKQCKLSLVAAGETVGRAEINDLTMRLAGAWVRMGGIANVVVQSQHRGKGYASRLMREAVSYMEREGYAVSILFGIPDFYHRFGYVPVTPEYNVSVAVRRCRAALGYDSRSTGAAGRSRRVARPVYARQCTPQRHRPTHARFLRGAGRRGVVGTSDADTGDGGGRPPDRVRATRRGPGFPFGHGRDRAGRARSHCRRQPDRVGWGKRRSRDAGSGCGCRCPRTNRWSGC